MNHYNFELANNSYAQQVMKLAGASGACLFLYNDRFNDERAVSFLHSTHLHSEAIEIYRHGLYKHDTFLPAANSVKYGRDPYVNTKRKRTIQNVVDCAQAARNNRKYWKILAAFGYEETGAMVQKLSRHAYLVIGVHLENHKQSLQLDKTLSTLECWITEAGDYTVDQSLLRYQASVGRKKPTYDLEAEGRCLTHRERQVVCEVLKGKSNKEIAAALTLSDYTVDNHLRRIYKKFNVHNRTSLAAALTTQSSFSN